MAIRKIIKRATDALFTNTEFDGTEATRMVKGTTGQRASAEAGDLRFNTTTSLMEYYDGVQWKSIDSPPIISSISPTVETDPSANIVITGSNFQSGATVKFVGDDGTQYPSPTVTIDSATQITATTPTTALSVANEPYDVVVTNSSGLAGTLADALDAGGVPAFTESAGSLGIVYDSARTGLSFDAGATDPDGDTITYSISSSFTFFSRSIVLENSLKPLDKAYSLLESSSSNAQIRSNLSLLFVFISAVNFFPRFPKPITSVFIAFM